MSSRQCLSALMERVAGVLRGYFLRVLLAGLYFLILTPFAFVWRWFLRRSLFRMRGGWVKVNETTDTPGLFSRSA